MTHEALLFAGGDNRSAYAAQYLKAKGYTISFYDPYYAKYNEIIENNIIILPVPVSRDGVNITGINGEMLTIKKLSALLTKKHLLIGGNLHRDLRSAAKNAGARVYDMMSVPKFVYKNARLSAEGLLCKIIESTPFSISGINVLLLGYGRCGLCIADLLDELGANVYVYDKDPERNAMAEANGLKLLGYTLPFRELCLNAHLVINAVTDDILSESFIKQFQAKTYIFNISSKKPVFEADSYINELIYHDCPGLPGKYVPQSAGNVIGETIDDYLKSGA